MNIHLHIPDEARPYLRLQRGEIYDMQENFIAWYQVYERLVGGDLAMITRSVPKASSVLDIGSGLGGIDILLSRAWDCKVALMDGVNDEPILVRHAKSFSNKAVALAYFRANGVKKPDYVDPNHRHPVAADLVISLGSWCFHYPPSVYLDYVLHDCTGVQHMVVDLRTKHPEWRAQLLEHFEIVDNLLPTAKLDRLVLKRR
jgi:SAM-dependent methyltransferase